MKKYLLLTALLLIHSSSLYALDPEGRTTHGPLVRPWMVVGRGVVNIAGLPFEIPLTIAREADMHSRLWPISFFPRTLNNIFIRSASAANDIFFGSVWQAPYTDDLSPLTESMGLPEYPWQFE